MKDWIDEHIRTLSEVSGLSSDAAHRLFDQNLYIAVDPEMRDNRTYRTAFAFAVTLLSRMFPRVRFDVLPNLPHLILPWGNDPHSSAEQRTPQTVLVFGSGRTQAPGCRLVTANCHDWEVYIDLQIDPEPKEEWNPILALVTACYAAARVTKVLLGDAVDGPDKWRPFSILDFRDGRVRFDWNHPVDAGEVHFAGIGAVGTSALYALAVHNSLFGKLVLVDPEQLDRTNLGRYVLYNLDDVGSAKVSAAKERLRELGVTMPLQPIEQKFQQYFDSRYSETSTFRVEKLVSAPDRRRIRRQFQSKLPQRLWDASTGPDLVVLHHNSFESSCACLECIYPEIAEENAHLNHVAETLNVPVERVLRGDPITSEDATKIADKYPHLVAERVVGRAFDSVFRELCSAGQLRGASAGVFAPFPFISALAGVLLYFELIKSLEPDIFGPFQTHNYTRLNPMFPPNPDCRELQLSRPDCSCQRREVRDLFSLLWPND